MDGLATRRLDCRQRDPRNSTRQLTIISRERWGTLMAGLGASTDPAARRANLMVSGVDLAHTRDRTLRVGAVRIRIREGAFGAVPDDGVVTVGDAVSWEE